MSGLPAIAVSLKIAAWASLLGFAPGILAAWFLANSQRFGHRLLEVIVNIPLALPPAVVGYGLLVALGKHSPVSYALSALGIAPLIFTPAAAVIAAMVVSFPLLVQTARLGFAAVRPDVVEAAALDGASAWLIFRFIQSPLAWPGVVSGVLLAFVRALGEFGATLMVAGNIPGRTQTMALAIYEAVQTGNNRDAQIFVVVLVLTSIAVQWLGMLICTSLRAADD